MSENDVLRRAIEDMVDGNDVGDEGADNVVFQAEDLPRIVVGEDFINVFPLKDDFADSEDEKRSEKSVYENVSEEEFSVDDLVLSEAGLGNVLKRGLFGDVGREDTEREDLGDLEESVGGVEREGAGGDFYEVSSGSQELSFGDSFNGPYDVKKYDVKKYDEKSEAAEFYDELIDEGKVDGFIETPGEVRRGGRSMLEIVGFRDEEAEKRREEKGRFF